MSNVRAEVGSATALDADDGCFDASVSTQVLEYIEDVGVALAELARVTRVGGRFVNVATNWDSLFVAGGDVELTERIIGAWDRHAPHPNLPVALPNHLTRAGFSSVLQTPLPLANRTFNRSTFAFGIANLMAAFAVAAGAIDDALIAIVAVQPRQSEQTRRSLHLRDADDDDGDESGVDARVSALLLWTS